MTDHPQLGVYDLAYICGGPARVATVVVFALAEDGQVTISRALHRVRIVRRTPRDDAEAAVLDALPDTGRPLGALITAAAGSAAVDAIGAALRDRRLLPRSLWQLGRIARVQRMRRRLRASPGEGIGRVAILGPEGIADAALRTVFQTPDPRFKLPDLKIPRLPDHNDRRYDADADVHTAAQLDMLGPDGSGWGL